MNSIHIFPRRSGFSLIEILAVLTVISILGVVGIAAFTNLRGQQLSQAGQQVSEAIALARQEAVRRNQDVQVVFLDTDAAGGWDAIQLRTVNETVNGQVELPLGKVNPLPSSVVICPESSLSPLLTSASAVSGTFSGGVYNNVAYKGFRIRSSGSLDSAITPSDNFLTLKIKNQEGLPPKNYCTIQINAITSAVQIYRP